MLYFNMKIVRESLNEFHQTGDPLKSLDIGIDNITIPVMAVILRGNSHFNSPAKIIHIENEEEKRGFQNILDKKRYEGLEVYFKDPESEIEFNKKLADFKILYGDKYKFIKYYEYYFEF